MTQEEKQLLLIDLCARLPYGVKLCYKEFEYGIISTLRLEHIETESFHLITNPYRVLNIDSLLYEIKPYLRPMPSMTEGEVKEYRMFIDYSYNDFTSESFPCVYVENINDYLDWLLAHHFDYRGLIGKGLALEAPEGMYE